MTNFGKTSNHNSLFFQFPANYLSVILSVIINTSVQLIVTDNSLWSRRSDNKSYSISSNILHVILLRLEHLVETSASCTLIIEFSTEILHFSSTATATEKGVTNVRNLSVSDISDVGLHVSQYQL